MTERFLWQLRMIGAFDEINGMIIGRTNATEYLTTSKDYGLHKVVLDATEGYDFPIISDMDFGHTLPMFTLPYGIKASMKADARRASFALLEKAVEG